MLETYPLYWCAVYVCTSISHSYLCAHVQTMLYSSMWHSQQFRLPNCHHNLIIEGLLEAFSNCFPMLCVSGASWAWSLHIAELLFSAVLAISQFNPKWTSFTPSPLALKTDYTSRTALKDWPHQRNSKWFTYHNCSSICLTCTMLGFDSASQSAIKAERVSRADTKRQCGSL